MPEVERLVDDAAGIAAEFGLQRLLLRRNLVVVQIHQRTVGTRRGRRDLPGWHVEAVFIQSETIVGLGPNLALFVLHADDERMLIRPGTGQLLASPQRLLLNLQLRTYGAAA